MVPVLAFDIETIPDVAGLRLLRGADAALSDADVYAAEIADRAARNKSDFMPLYLQRVLVISCVFRGSRGLQVRSFVDLERDGKSEEAGVIQSFFNRVNDHRPQLVSWNGGGFDLPVLHYRALRHGIQAPRYWESGEEDQAFRWNNYLNRYHSRHMDLMDVLSSFQARARVSLQSAAMLLGLPGKLGMSGDKVWDTWLDGGIDAIRNYCETDVLNTFLVYLRFELMRGKLTREEFAAEQEGIRTYLQSQGESRPHFGEFLAAWGESQC